MSASNAFRRSSEPRSRYQAVMNSRCKWAHPSFATTPPFPGSLAAMAKRKRNGGAKDVIRIVEVLGLGQPFGVAAIAAGRTIDVISAEKIRISAGQRSRERFAGNAGPMLMSLLFERVGSVGETCYHLDHHMVA